MFFLGGAFHQLACGQFVTWLEFYLVVYVGRKRLEGRFRSSFECIQYIAPDLGGKSCLGSVCGYFLLDCSFLQSEP
jgi:hypothetical protein